MNKITLKAEKRKVTGRKVKSLRKQGTLPTNVYGKKVKSEALSVGLNEFGKVYEQAGETGLVELQIGKETKPVLIHEVQVDPVTGTFLHADFLQVDLKEKVTATVAVEVVGESPAEKSGIGTVVLQLSEIEVEALPSDLPEKFVIEAEKLAEVDQAVKVSDLPYDKAKVEIKADPEAIVVKVEPPQKEEVVAAPAPAEGEASAEGEAKPVEEGKEAAPAEGGEQATEAKTEEPQKAE